MSPQLPPDLIPSRLKLIDALSEGYSTQCWGWGLGRPLFHGGRCSSMRLVLRHGLHLYLPQITYSYVGINTNYVALHDIQENQQMKHNFAILFIRRLSNPCTPIHLSARRYLLRLVHKANDQSNTIWYDSRLPLLTINPTQYNSRLPLSNWKRAAHALWSCSASAQQSIQHNTI